MLYFCRYIYSIWALIPSLQPLQVVVELSREQMFEAVGEKKFLPVQAHNLLLLKRNRQKEAGVVKHVFEPAVSHRKDV